MRPVLVAALLLLSAAAGASAAERSSVRDARYCELFVVRRTGLSFEADVYNTLGLNDCPDAAWQAIDTKALAAKEGALAVVRNGPRHFVMDAIEAPAIPTDAIDLDGLAMRRVAVLPVKLSEMIEDRSSYRERPVGRTTRWIYEAGQPVFELTDPAGHVYVMQSYAAIVDPKLGYGQLAGLGARLKPPEGWRYRSRVLDADLVLSAPGAAHILQDELQNTYQLVTP
jgi:hypothetical protein